MVSKKLACRKRRKAASAEALRPLPTEDAEAEARAVSLSALAADVLPACDKAAAGLKRADQSAEKERKAVRACCTTSRSGLPSRSSARSRK